MTQLSLNEHITIKPADKGGATVILNSEDYNNSVKAILSDTQNYTEIDNFDLAKITKIVSKLIQKYKLHFTKAEIDYLTNFEHKLATIYGLPKIHKCPKLKNLIKNSITDNTILCTQFESVNIPFRKILSGTNCPVSRICELAKIMLRPFELCIPHLIIDTTHFLSIIPDTIQSSYILVAIDIVQLYPSITNELGLQSINYWIDKYPEKINEKFNKSIILDVIQFIQDNVYFSFLDKTYKQINGTAMGKSQAPQYANLTVAFLIIER